MADEFNLMQIADQLRLIATALDTQNKILIDIRKSLQGDASRVEGQQSVYEERFKEGEQPGD
jgi:hypothetical protein